MWTKRLGLLFLLLCCKSGFTQSLTEFIHLALAQNYGIQIQQNNAQIAQNNNTRGNAGQLPMVDLNANQQQNINTSEQVFFTGDKRSGDGAKTTITNAQLLINWTVFDGFRMFAEKSKLAHLEKIGDLEARFQIEQSIADLIILYHQLIYATQQLNNIQKVVEISEYRVEIEAKRRSVGSGNILAYQQALVDQQNDKILVLNQQQLITNLHIQLNTLINESPLKTIEVIVPEINLSNYQQDSLVNQIQQHNFQYQQVQLQELVAEKDITIAKALKYPSVTFFGGYAYSNNVNEIGFIQKNLNYGNTIGINVRMNLYNGGRNNLAIKNAKIQHQNAQNQQLFLQQELSNQGILWFTQWQNLQEQYQLALKNEATAKNMSAIAEQQFKLGAITGYEYRLSQLSLLQTIQKNAELSFQLAVINTHINRLSGGILKKYLQ